MQWTWEPQEAPQRPEAAAGEAPGRRLRLGEGHRLRLALGFGLSPQGRRPLNLQGALPGGGLLGTLVDDPVPGGGPGCGSEGAHGKLT